MPDPAADHARARALIEQGGEAARAEAEGLLAAAAGAGHAPAQALLGELLMERADARALPLLQAAAGAGHARAQFRLGLLHAQGGAGLVRDLAAARRWCAAAAAQGLAVAQFNLALLNAEAGEADEAARWWRLAAINGVAEAEACLDELYRDGVAPPRPRTWDEADTRASVALERSDPAAPKTVRFGDYYVDPCVDLLMHRHRLDRERAEEIVQQFFCEMEEPLERGEHRGRAWKDALRERYDPARGAFRPYLRQALVNFARDWFRRDARPPRDDERPLDPLAEALQRRGEWQPLLDAFLAAMTAARKDAARAAQVAHAVLAEGAAQAELGARLGVSERTLRTDLRLGAELLRDWLEARLAALPADSDPVLASLVAGLPLVPEWLHRPTIEKRGRALLYLLLVQRRLGPAALR